MIIPVVTLEGKNQKRPNRNEEGWGKEGDREVGSLKRGGKSGRLAVYNGRNAKGTGRRRKGPPNWKGKRKLTRGRKVTTRIHSEAVRGGKKDVALQER